MGVNNKDTHGFIVTNQTKIVFEHFRGKGYSEAFKISNKEGVFIWNCVFYGGSEDCLDSVRSKLEVSDSAFLPNKETKQSITAKGGSEIHLINCHFEGSPKFDISIGDFTIYDGVTKIKPSKLIMKNCTAATKRGNNRPIKVLVVNGESICENTNCQITKVPKLLVKIYFWIMSKLMSKERRKEAIRNILEANKV